jgi:hypothetical protein
MDEDVVAGQDPGHVALAKVDDGQAETAGVIPGGILEEIEKGDGPDEAAGVRFVRVDGVFLVIDELGHDCIIYQTSDEPLQFAEPPVDPARQDFSWKTKV